MVEMQTASKHPTGRHQRKLKNYLIDPGFQLKYANYVALIALVIGGGLGALLWTSTETTIEQSRASVELGAEVLRESKKVSEVVRMNIVKDPMYSDNPVLKAAFDADVKEQNKKLEGQQEQLQAQATRLEKQRTQFATLLIVTMVLLVGALWLSGIVITHRVAGPVYKMKKQIRKLEAGSLEVPSPLRRGDELKAFFDAFNDMVRALRTRHESDVGRLDSAIEVLQGKVSDDQLRPLKELREQMQEELEA